MPKSGGRAPAGVAELQRVTYRHLEDAAIVALVHHLRRARQRESVPLTTIEVRLDPRVLDNPDLDLRYLIPDTVEARSGGSVRSDGYDYEGDVPIVVMFLLADDAPSAVELITALLDAEPLLGNELRGEVQRERRRRSARLVPPAITYRRSRTGVLGLATSGCRVNAARTESLQVV